MIPGAFHGRVEGIVTKREIIESRLREIGDAERARHHLRFFRTGPGEYGEGDRFFGVRVPGIRALVNKFRPFPLDDARSLLESPWHEARLFALLAMVDRFIRGNENEREAVFRLYMDHTHHVNNWDLVDSSAPRIVGGYLFEKNRAPLYQLALSPLLWERRIAIIATHYFIRKGDFFDTLKISAMLLEDREDLIHKAVGWMLREVGNRDREAEEVFLRAHCRTMPRTMLRYAIEKFPPHLRQWYMKGGKP